MKDNNREQCPVCKVEIEEDVVYFSFGNPGTRERLYARVCKFALDRNRTDCINQSVNTDNITDNDGYDVFPPSKGYVFTDPKMPNT
jgi:hypothetical protein